MYQNVALGSRQFHTVAEASSHLAMPREAKLFPTSLPSSCTSFSPSSAPRHSLSWDSPGHRVASQCSLLTQQKCPLFPFYPPKLIFCHFTKLGYCIEMPELNPEVQWQSVVGEKERGGVRSFYLAAMSCYLGPRYLLKLLKHE